MPILFPLGPSNAAVRQKHEILAKNLPEGYNPGFNFVVVQKRINTRIFGGQKRPAGGMEYINPPAGTIVDHMVTRLELMDLFSILQCI